MSLKIFATFQAELRRNNSSNAGVRHSSSWRPGIVHLAFTVKNCHPVIHLLSDDSRISYKLPKDALTTVQTVPPSGQCFMFTVNNNDYFHLRFASNALLKDFHKQLMNYMRTPYVTMAKPTILLHPNSEAPIRRSPRKHGSRTPDGDVKNSDPPKRRSSDNNLVDVASDDNDVVIIDQENSTPSESPYSHRRICRSATPALQLDVPQTAFPRDKENQHRTPTKQQMKNDASPGRTPLADKSSERAPRSIPKETFYGTSTPDTKVPGLANFKTPSYDQRFKSSKRPFLSMDTSDFFEATTKKPKVCRNESDIGWKSIPFSPIPVDGSQSDRREQLKGFSNIGNTCYMNSILQALFGLDPFARELYKTYQHFNDNIPKEWLFSSLPKLLGCKDSENQTLKDDLLRSIKRAISSTATRFSGYSQHDAHEFLAQVFDQLKEEINKLTENRVSAEKPPPNPVQNNFEFAVCHFIHCQSCQNVSTKEEQFNDLSLDMPFTALDNDEPVNLQTLLDSFFKEETVSYKCESCGGDAALIRHKFTKLPRILTLHLKRYSYDNETSSNLKIASIISIPRFLALHNLCSDNIVHTPLLSASTKKIVIPKKEERNGAQSPNSTPTGGKERSQARKALFGGEPKKYLFRKRPANPINYNEELPSISDKEDDDLKEVLERSRRETGPPTEEENDDTSFQRDIQEAMRRSLLETSPESAVDNGSENGTANASDSNGDVKEIKVENGEEDDELKRNAEEGYLTPAFRLCGVVNHLGSSSSTGHYVSDVWNTKSSNWHSYDDSRVTIMSEADVRRIRQKTAYIFFYIAKSLLDDAD